MQTASTEKRIFPRLECRIPLTLLSANADTTCVDGYDLSLTGVGVEIDPEAEIQLGEHIHVLIEGFPSVTACVRWRQGRRVGLHFCAGVSEIVSSWVGDILALRGVLFRDLLPS